MSTNAGGGLRKRKKGKSLDPPEAETPSSSTATTPDTRSNGAAQDSSTRLIRVPTGPQDQGPIYLRPSDTFSFYPVATIMIAITILLVCVVHMTVTLMHVKRTREIFDFLNLTITDT